MFENKFEIPAGWSPEKLAQTFNAFLLGGLAYKNTDQKKGPYRKEDGSDDAWQLDGSNDYWLHIDGQTARLTSRYSNDQPTVEAMITLFQLRYCQ